MGKKLFYLSGLIVLLLAALAAPLRAQRPPQELAIYFSNDVHGETEPCG